MTNTESVALQEKESRIMAEGFVENVYNDLNDIKHSFFRIGFRLQEANELEYYKVLGYQNITELAEDKFGFKKSTTYELMQIYELAHSEQCPFQISDKYDKFSKSQLGEFCRLKFATMDFMKIVTPSDTVADIHEAITLWNKYVATNSCTPEVRSIAELLRKLKEPKPPVQSEPQTNGQLPGQTVIDLPSEEEQQEETVELQEGSSEVITAVPEADNFSAYAENSIELVEELPQINDDELINKCLKKHMGIITKFKIYAKFNESPLRAEFVEFVKNLYGIGGHRSPVIRLEYNPEKGVTIYRKDDSKIELPWAYVAGRISRLIETGEYLSIEEQAGYVQWKAQQDGLIVSEEPAAVPAVSASEKSANAEKLNFKNDKARREWLDNFRDWGEWISVPEVNKTFYRFNFANGCALIVETGIEYYESYKGLKEKEIKSYSIIDKQHAKYDSHGISYTFVIQWLSEHRDEI